MLLVNVKVYEMPNMRAFNNLLNENSKQFLRIIWQRASSPISEHIRVSILGEILDKDIDEVN